MAFIISFPGCFQSRPQNLSSLNTFHSSFLQPRPHHHRYHPSHLTHDPHRPHDQQEQHHNERQHPLTNLKMTLPDLAKTTMAIYGLLMTGGGITAYVKSKSKMSLISGVGSGIILGVAFMKESLSTALAIAILLTIIFLSRYWKSKKLMPSGVLSLVSFIATLIFAFTMSTKV